MTTVAEARIYAGSIRYRHAWVLEWLRGSSTAVMLYGSQARGDARADSDVDVLQVVEDRARTYSVGEMNVSAYSAAHLRELASRGSLFVRHLRDEGVILSDSDRVLEQILSEYVEPASYCALRAELAVVVSALGLPGAEQSATGAAKTASFVVRSLLYAASAEADSFEFDVIRASAHIGRPQIGIDLRSPDAVLQHQLRHARWLLSRAGTHIPLAPGRTFEEAVVWVGATNPSAATLLEAVLAGDAMADYTSLTLPMS